MVVPCSGAARRRAGRPPARPARSPVGSTSIDAPMRRSTSTNAMRVGLSATPSITSSEPGVIVAATHQNAADDGSPGTSSVERRRRARARPGPSCRRRVDRRAERGEHALGVVAARRRLGDLGDAVGLQAGEHQRGLHLRAGDRELVRGAPRARRPGPRAARACRRRGRRPCAPIARSGSTTRRHRPCTQRLASPVSTLRNGRPASSPLSSADRRARVAAVDDAVGLARARRRRGRRRRACARRRSSHGDAERVERARGCARRRRRRARPVSARLAVGERGEQQRAVRDALVAGDPQPAAQRCAPPSVTTSDVGRRSGAGAHASAVRPTW